MPDDTEDFGTVGEGESGEPGRRSGSDEEADDDVPTYHSGRVRIIGAEPAGDSMREVTGPVVEQHPDLPHWNDAPTGQVPAILDRSNGEEPLVAPPTWREEDTDWEAQEDVFEPSMLSEDLPAVGALVGEIEDGDVERQPWHFESALSDETLIIEPDYPDPETVIHTPEPALAPVAEAALPMAEEPEVAEVAAPRLVPRRRTAKTPLAEKSAVAASRLSPPGPPRRQ